MAEKFRIPGKCPSCGAPNTSGSNFCLYCGTYFGEPQSSPDKEKHHEEKSDGLPLWDAGPETNGQDNGPVIKSEPEPADIRDKTSRKQEKKFSQKM